jgi:hypothetical protein
MAKSNEAFHKLRRKRQHQHRRHLRRENHTEAQRVRADEAEIVSQAVAVDDSKGHVELAQIQPIEKEI